MTVTKGKFMTLDGVVQGPGAAQEDPSDGFELGGWLPPHFDEAVGACMSEIFAVADEFLLGRRTYDLMAACWPGQTNPDGSVFELNALLKHVATTRTDELAWEGSSRLEGDTATARRGAEARARPGAAGARQRHAGALADGRGSRDAYRLLVFPVAPGRGRRLFDGTPPTGLRLTDSRMSASGVAMLTNEAAGRPTFGSVLDEDTPA